MSAQRRSSALRGAAPPVASGPSGEDDGLPIPRTPSASTPRSRARLMDSEGQVTHSRRGLHGRVVDYLGAQIINGVLLPGFIIDPDRLIAEMQVSRTVLREAFKVLTSKGMLDARPHTGTFVLGRERWNLLDADVIRWRNANGPDARLLRELEEVRQMVEPWGSRLAAERRTEQEMAGIREAFESLAETESSESTATADADVRFHRILLAAAHNELLDRLERLLEPLLRVRDVIAHQSNESELGFVDSHRAVVDCVQVRDADGAFAAMTALLRGAAADTEDSLGPAQIAPAPRQQWSSSGECQTSPGESRNSTPPRSRKSGSRR